MAILGTKEWAPNNRNICDGCSNDCRYCYAKLKAIRYGRRTKENWHEMRLLKVRQSTKKVEGGIMFPTTHDLHYKHRDCWFPFLKEMLENGNEVLIVSKPEISSIRFMCDNLMQFNRQIEFRFTIGTNDDTTRQFWEPHAPSIKERIMALQLASEAGYKTSVSMEPLLMYNPRPLIEKVNYYTTGEIWIGLMNYIKESDFAPEERRWYEIQKEINSLENIQKVYDDLNTFGKIRWKDSIWDLLKLPIAQSWRKA